MLTKQEKLLYSLSAIKEVIETLEINVELTINKDDGEYVINAYKEIEKCVVDYVNSLQPLKFEDLKPRMWLWDNKQKEWCVLSKYFKEILKVYYAHGPEELNYPFDENRFYRKQVEE